MKIIQHERMGFCFIISRPVSDVLGDVLYLGKNKQSERNQTDSESEQTGFLIKSHMNDETQAVKT